jgi:hypothetical protein
LSVDWTFWKMDKLLCSPFWGVMSDCVMSNCVMSDCVMSDCVVWLCCPTVLCPTVLCPTGRAAPILWQWLKFHFFVCCGRKRREVSSLWQPVWTKCGFEVFRLSEPSGWGVTSPRCCLDPAVSQQRSGLVWSSAV